MNIVPESAPFSREQRAWLNGFLAGALFDRLGSTPATAGNPSPTPSLPPLLVGFGSQSGSAATLAKQLARSAESRGHRVTLRELNAVSPTDLNVGSPFIVITSTWGDGDPPDNATGFWSVLSDPSVPRLDAVPFAVLGLGDRSYADFCGAARKFDERLEALGARRLQPRGECDVEFEESANAWINSLWSHLAPESSSPPNSSTASIAHSPEHAEPAVPQPLGRSRQNPYPARLRVARPLNAPGSAKDTRHVEILLEDPSLSYEAGDALGVFPQNCPALVEELLAALHLTGDEDPGVPEATSLHDALLRRWNITQTPVAFLSAAAERSSEGQLRSLLNPDRRTELDAWLAGRDLIDVLRAAPGARFLPSELGPLLRPLQHRLYSISSSPRMHPGEVHLTVGAVRYSLHGRPRKGVASCWLADRVLPHETPVPIFIHSSPNFRPPPDPTRPMIMVGPGTGIAPFRAFLQERRATGATGPNWLFFGDQCRASDFLYADELEPQHQDGFLTRLDLAFSRDQPEKIYVQDRMRSQASTLWAWLEDGAHFYVCGDARRMARDVDAALHEVIRTAGGRSADDATAYVAALRTAGRYQRDVY